jgi:hypothetical protein
MDIFKMYEGNYTSVMILAYRRHTVFEINRELKREVRNLAIFMEPNVYITSIHKNFTHRHQEALSGSYDIEVGAKIRFLNNIVATTIPLTSRCADVMANMRSSKETSLMKALGSAQMRPGRDYIISESVSNGEMDWVAEIVSIGEDSIELVRLRSGKQVVIGERHVPLEDVTLGICGTTYSSTGGEADHVVLLLNYDSDRAYMNSRQLLVGFSRARRSMHVLSTQHKTSTHKIRGALFVRERRAGRDPHLHGNLYESVYKEDREVIMDVFKTFQYVFSNAPIVRMTDFGTLFSRHCNYIRDDRRLRHVYRNMRNGTVVSEYAARLADSTHRKQFLEYVLEHMGESPTKKRRIENNTE